MTMTVTKMIMMPMTMIITMLKADETNTNDDNNINGTTITTITTTNSKNNNNNKNNKTTTIITTHWIRDLDILPCETLAKGRLAATFCHGKLFPSGGRWERLLVNAQITRREID